VRASTWKCPCGQPFADHRSLEAPTFALQREADRALAREASEATAPMVIEEIPPSEPAPAKAPRHGPHADRLERARAAHEAAIRPKPAPAPKPSPTKDPFEEDA
jgi:hypothetical protein